MEVEYSDQPEWGQLMVPNFHGPLAVHFLVLCFAMVVWVVEMVLHCHFNDSGKGRGKLLKKRGLLTGCANFKPLLRKFGLRR